MSLYIDLTEFLTSLRKTGIERIGGEICKHLPPRTVIPVRLVEGKYLTLAPELIEVIGRYFQNADDSGTAEIRKLTAAPGVMPVDLSGEDRLLIPEIFDYQRAAFFRGLSELELQRCRFIVYDLLPLTHPEYFLPDMPINMFGYFQAVRRAKKCGFISEYTRDDYYKRLKRTDVGDGVVLPLGCDSFGPKTSRLLADRRLTFSVLGTLEPRKNPELIVEAFEPLLKEIDGLQLFFLGKIGWINSTFAEKVRTLAADKDSGFHFCASPDDGTIRFHIEQSRATIYVSEAEGYGLPPVESLWLGTPVIASRNVPSLERLGTAGIHYVESLTVANLRRAVVDFLDDAHARKKREETNNLRLPTWQSFTDQVLQWCELPTC